MKILLIGATGKIGRQTTRELQLRGLRPRIGVRRTEEAQSLFGDELEYVPFDFTDPNTFKPALEGITRVFFIAPMKEPEEPAGTFLAAARSAGVRHLTFSSGRTTGDIEGKPLYRVERLVRESGLPHTILRPGWFMQNFTNWLGETLRSEGKLYLPAGDAKTAFVDVRDIAGVVVQTLLQTGHENRLYNLTSDQAIDHHEVVRLILRATGKNMTYVPLERPDFIQTMVDRGWTEAAATHTADLYDVVRTGKEAEISPDVKNILRRAPIRFGQFVQNYREVWL